MATTQVAASTVDAIKEKARRLSVLFHDDDHRSRVGPSNFFHVGG